METQPISKLLGQTTLFGGHSEKSLETIAQGCELRRCSAGEWIFRQGDPTQEMFVVVEGEFLALISKDDHGFDREIGEIHPGQHFGEVGVLEEGGRNASVRAQTDGLLIALPRERLIEAVNSHPEIGLELCRGFIRYIQISRQAMLAMPFVDLDGREKVVAHLVELLSPRISLACQALVIEQDDDLLTVGMVDPYDEHARDFVAEVLENYRVEFAGIGQQDFDRIAATLLEPRLGGARVTQIGERLQYLDDEGRPVDFGDDDEADLLRGLFVQAINSASSDIHFEPHSRNHRIRIRIDGSLFTVKDSIDDRVFRRLIARIKAMSQLDVANSRLPEDGRFVLVSGKEQVEVRVATAPCLGGQKAALRVIDPSQIRRDLSSLFVSKEIERISRDVLLNASGLALVVGPTGSGKTTTLYATLNALWERTKTINVTTIENPIEYELPFATQMQVNSSIDLTFEELLRHTLRQDPDVVLVGEIRDAESAAIATEAAGTGHLVLSSLHTDSALDAIVRLRRLGVPPYLLSSCLRGVIAQRLVPRVCHACEMKVKPGDEFAREAVGAGLISAEEASMLRRGKGCERCRSTGEAGRVAVFELLLVTESLRALIEKEAGVHEMRRELDRSDFLPMKEYSGDLLRQGIVSPERVVALFPKSDIRDAE